MCIVLGIGQDSDTWNFLLDNAEGFEKEKVENWKGDMDNLLVFVRRLETGLNLNSADSPHRPVCSPLW